MPRQAKNELYRKFGQAYYHADVALGDLLELKVLFEGVHPELAEGLEIAMKLIFNAQVVLNEFSLNAWNRQAVDLLDYRP